MKQEMKEMTEINCGERKVQKGFRIVITDSCKRHNIKEGDIVEVFLIKNGYEAYQEKMRQQGDDQERLHELFIEMKDLAKENMQEVPTGWFISEDGNTAYAEFDHRTPTVLATRNKDGEFKLDF